MGFFVRQHDQFLHWDITEVNINHIHLDTKSLFLLIIFCSLLIILTLLFFCGHRNHVSTAPTRTIIPPPPRTFGLDPYAINCLPVTLHLSCVKSNHNVDTRANYMQTECSICLGIFENEDKLKVLPDCNHAFHCDCLDKWLSSRSTCPLCRASLEVPLDEVVIPSQEIINY